MLLLHLSEGQNFEIYVEMSCEQDLESVRS